MDAKNSSISSAALSTQDAQAAYDEAAADQKVRDHVLAQYMKRLSNKKNVSGSDICEILASMGLNDDEAGVRPLLADWNNVSAEDAAEAVNTVRVSQGIDVQTVLHHIENDVVQLNLLQYLRYKLPCFEKDPKWAYRVVRLDFHVAPRHMLFASTGVVLLVTGMAILVLMSLLWLNQANERELIQMKNFHLLLSSFTQSFEQHFIKAHAETMVDQIDTLAKMIEKQQDFMTDDLKKEMADDVKLMASLLNVAGTSGISRLAAEVEGYLSSAADVFADAAVGFSLADFVSVIDAMHSSDAGGDVDLSTWESVVVEHLPGGGINVALESKMIECAYGPCEYSAVPCLQRHSDSMVRTHSRTTDVHRKEVLAVSVTIASRNVTVCASRSLESISDHRNKVLAETISDWNAIMREVNRNKPEILLGAAPTDAATNPWATWLTPMLRKEHGCYMLGECVGLDQLAAESQRTGTAMHSVVRGYSGVDLHAAAAVTEFGLVVVLSVPFDGFLEDSRQEIVEILDYLNFNSQRTTELSVARRDPKTGVVIAQVNKFRFTNLCFTKCERIQPSTAAARLGLDTQSSGWVIASDYRPQPVLGAYSFIGNGVNMVLIIERDMMEIRTIGLGALTNIFNDNNKKYTGTLEAQLVRFAGMTPMRTYDPFARCDHIRECITVPELGTIYRSDCVHCARAPIPAPTEIEFLTDLKLDCGGNRNCTRFGLGDDTGVARRPLVDKNEQSVSLYGSDYRGQEVLAVYSFVSNFSVGLIVKLDREEIEGPITRMIGIAVGTAIAIVIVGLVMLIFFSRKVLDKIEFEWLSYKKQIDQEKEKFDDMVKDVIPKQIKDELLSGQKLALSLPALSIVFVDICNMSDKSKAWSPELVCRYLTYTFAVIEECSNFYKLSKVRMYGDTYFGVGGLADPRTIDHSMMRTASFGSVLIQLFSNKFAHYPDRIPVLRKTFEEIVAKNGPAFPDVQGNYEDVGHIVAPNIRIGIHHGVATFCLIETGRTPTFDVFGASVALAARMQATSQPNKMHLSGAAKEVLERTDRERLFEFDDARKTVVKGQGTVTSYFINSANVAIPSSIIGNLGIEYANLRVFYEDQQQGAAADGGGGGGGANGTNGGAVGGAPSGSTKSSGAARRQE